MAKPKSIRDFVKNASQFVSMNEVNILKFEDDGSYGEEMKGNKMRQFYDFQVIDDDGETKILRTSSVKLLDKFADLEENGGIKGKTLKIIPAGEGFNRTYTIMDLTEREG